MNAAQQSDRMPASWCSRCRGHVHATAISGWSAVGESVRLRLFLDILPLHPLLAQRMVHYRILIDCYRAAIQGALMYYLTNLVGYYTDLFTTVQRYC